VELENNANEELKWDAKMNDWDEESRKYY